jgi:hypothetical protein
VACEGWLHTSGTSAGSAILLPSALQLRTREDVRSVTEPRRSARGHVGARTVQPYGVAPPAGGVAGDVHGDLHHQLRVDERDVRDVAAAPPSGERTPRPRVLTRGRRQQSGERVRRGAGERDGPAGVAQRARAVVAAEQQRAGSGRRTGDRADDGVGGGPDLLVKRQRSDLALFSAAGRLALGCDDGTRNRHTRELP